LSDADLDEKCPQKFQEWHFLPPSGDRVLTQIKDSALSRCLLNQSYPYWTMRLRENNRTVLIWKRYQEVDDTSRQRCIMKKGRQYNAKWSEQELWVVKQGGKWVCKIWRELEKTAFRRQKRFGIRKVRSP